MSQKILDAGRMEAICGFDIPGNFKACNVCGNGHINDTYMMTFEQNGVLQSESLCIRPAGNIRFFTMFHLK